MTWIPVSDNDRQGFKGNKSQTIKKGDASRRSKRSGFKRCKNVQALPPGDVVCGDWKFRPRSKNNMSTGAKLPIGHFTADCPDDVWKEGDQRPANLI